MTWLAVPLAGCHRYTLDDVPIVGGTASQREVVRSVLDEFESATGGGRVRLSSVQLEDLQTPSKVGSGVALRGVYQRSTGRIVVDPDGLERDLPYTVRHELCHALDFQQDLAEDPSGVWGRASEQLAADPSWTADAVAGKDARSRRSEALALFCEGGTHYAHLLSPPCSSDPDGIAEIARALLGQVWWDPPPLPTAAVGERGTVLWDQVVTDIIPIPAPTTDAGLLQLYLAVDPIWENPVADLFTGDTVDALVAQAGTGEYSGWASFSDGPWGWKAEVSDSVGSEGGPDALLGRVFLWHLGWSGYRLFWSPDGQQWRVAGEGCAREGEHPFFADDTPWTFWVEGDRAMWTRLGRPVGATE